MGFTFWWTYVSGLDTWCTVWFLVQFYFWCLVLPSGCFGLCLLAGFSFYLIVLWWICCFRLLFACVCCLAMVSMDLLVCLWVHLGLFRGWLLVVICVGCFCFVGGLYTCLPGVGCLCCVYFWFRWILLLCLCLCCGLFGCGDFCLLILFWVWGWQVLNLIGFCG